MYKKGYPYQDTSVNNIRGEQWKDIPGLEMYFQVSNYGRIKRLEYESVYSDGRVYRKPAKIIKPVLMKLQNHFVNDQVFFLRTCVTLFRQRFNYSVARLVYCVFVKSFTMDDKDIVILCKDSDNCNIKPSNLKLSTHHEKQKRVFELKRYELLFTRSDAWQQGIEKARLKNNKQVTKYTMQGKKIKSYPSVIAAVKETGISHGHISNRARGLEFSAGGFIWRYGNDKCLDLSSIQEKIKKRIQKNKEQFGTRVTQYDMKGNRIATYLTIADAANAVGINHAQVTAMIQRKGNSAGGFYWQKGYGPAKINLAGHEYGETLRTKRRQKKIKQYSKAGTYLQTFDSIKEAAAKVGVTPTTITGALKGKHQTAGGYKWKYIKKK